MFLVKSTAIDAASGACAAYLLSDAALSVTGGALAGAAGSIAGVVTAAIGIVLNCREVVDLIPALHSSTVLKICDVVLGSFIFFLGIIGVLHVAKIQMAFKTIVIFAGMASGISCIILLAKSFLGSDVGIAGQANAPNH